VIVAELRADLASHFDNPECIRLVEHLCRQSPLFVECWQSHGVLELVPRTKVLCHPDHGILQFNVRSADLMSPANHRLVLHLPAEDGRTRLILRDMLARAERHRSLTTPQLRQQARRAGRPVDLSRTRPSA